MNIASSILVSNIKNSERLQECHLKENRQSSLEKGQQEATVQYIVLQVPPSKTSHIR